MTFISEIKERAQLGSPPISSGRSVKSGKISFDDLVFIAPQLTAIPIDYFREQISTETIIGKYSANPLRLSTPIIIGAMSFGALSKEAKIALARASSLVGTATNTGEGGMLPEEREAAKLLIVQYSTGRFGISEKVLKVADAIEIKIGQSAKPGQGGLLSAAKVTKEIAKLRGVPVGRDAHSPPSHPDIKNIDDLKKKVDWLRELTQKPIIIKLAAGNIEEDVKLAVRAGPDAIAIDGLGGGTGAAPKVMLDEFGVPTLVALVKARKVLNRLGAKQQLLIGGGLNKGADVAKALALGADAVFMATSMLIAMGCMYCRQCFKGTCPFGIATQDTRLRKKLNIDSAAKRVVNFIRACTEEVKMVAAATGKSDVHRLSGSDLRSLTLELAQITGIPLI